MSADPPVCVVIPVKDGGRFIEACLRSVVVQAGPPFEVIVVDDGSTDASAEIAVGIDPALVRVIPGPERGPGPARNTGVAASSAPLVAFIDADDEMMEGRLAWQARYLDEHPEVAAVFGRQELALEVDEATAAPVLRPDRQFHDPGGLSVMSGMFRRGPFESIGGFDESYFVTEDLDLVFRMRAAGLEMAFEDRHVVRRRIHGDNLTLRSADDIRAELLRSVRTRVQDHRTLARSSEEEGSA